VTGAACRAGNSYPSGALISPLVSTEGYVALSFVYPYFLCNCLVFWIMSFDSSFCLIAWYLYICFTLLRKNK